MITLILAGGSGTRLFPLSRTLYPKQFIPMFDHESLFKNTVKRALLVSDPEDVYVITNINHEFLVRDQLKEAGCEKGQVMTEPMSRNTLPAIYYGMQQICEECGIEDVAVLPSDHRMTITAEYVEAFERAKKLSDRFLVTFGIRPDFPHTGYGYIKPGDPLGDAHRVDRFVEKPDLETAKQYVSDGYLWNSGMFLFNSETFFHECDRYASDMVEAFTRPVEEAFSRCPSISIDYGIMEKTGSAAVVSLSSGWNDMGNFKALYEISDKDVHGNAARCDYIPIDSSHNLVIGDHLIATIGVNNLAVIDTKDALVICPLTESQRIGEIVKHLQARNDPRIDLHTTVYRPWGYYTLLEEGDLYKIKRVTVLPKRRLSHQYHHHRSEHWIVVSGMARVTTDGKEYFLRPGESTFVPAGVKHRIENPGLIPLEVIEVQNGQYMGEDDIIRFDDDFGRE